METTANRELRITKTLKAPIDLVWEVWSKPEHIAQWWGPKGFTNTIKKMEFKEGGEWKFTMHGPDGTDYANKSVFREIIPFKKIVFEHLNPHYIATIIFESNGHETHLDWTGIFDSEEILQAVIKAHKADEGLKQNIERLELYLNKKINQK